MNPILMLLFICFSLYALKLGRWIMPLVILAIMLDDFIL
jgi:hypothetical protein